MTNWRLKGGAYLLLLFCQFQQLGGVTDYWSEDFDEGTVSC